MEFSQIATFLVLSAAVGIIFQLLKQPLIIGFIFSGFILAVLGITHESLLLSSLGQIGITLLLFLLGMEIDVHEIKSLGKTVLIAGLAQIILTFLLGFSLAQIIGFSQLEGAYIGLAVSFSSTIIVVKLLTENKDMTSLYGRLTLGILLVQDVVAVTILMFLSSAGSGTFGLTDILWVAVKGIFLIVLTWTLSKRILPKIFGAFVSQSQELVFITSIAWALGISAFVNKSLGFSLEIGGFLAGLSLSNLPEHLQIAAKTRPLRDFFLVIFFMLLGMQLVVGEVGLGIVPIALFFSFFVLVVKTLIIIGILGIMGYKKRTSFMTANALSQVSEFSLIIVALGLRLGQINQNVVSIMVLVGAITMTTSTYMINGVEKLYKTIKNELAYFERKVVKEGTFNIKSDMSDHIVIVGCHRTGRALIRYFGKKNYPFLVVDFNPKVYETLTAKKVNVIFGDINDSEIQEVAGIKRAKLLISTVGNLSDNMALLEYVNNQKHQPVTIFTANKKSDALRLYEKNASYVIVPEVLAGDYIKKILRIYGYTGERLTKAGKSHFNRLLYA